MRRGLRPWVAELARRAALRQGAVEAGFHARVRADVPAVQRSEAFTGRDGVIDHRVAARPHRRFAAPGRGGRQEAGEATRSEAAEETETIGAQDAADVRGAARTGRSYRCITCVQDILSRASYRRSGAAV